MDTLPLPPRPHLDQYRKRAKDLVAAARSSDPDAIRAWAADLIGAIARLTGAQSEFVRHSIDRAVEEIGRRIRDAAGPTKGTALRALCERQGLTPREAVVVGDWVNDVPMFEVAGRSFAMGGVPDDVRSKATDVLEQPHGEGGGIAEAIRRAWG